MSTLRTCKTYHRKVASRIQWKSPSAKWLSSTPLKTSKAKCRPNQYVWANCVTIESHKSEYIFMCARCLRWSSGRQRTSPKSLHSDLSIIRRTGSRYGFVRHPIIILAGYRTGLRIISADQLNAGAESTNPWRWHNLAEWWLALIPQQYRSIQIILNPGTWFWVGFHGWPSILNKERDSIKLQMVEVLKNAPLHWWDTGESSIIKIHPTYPMFAASWSGSDGNGFPSEMARGSRFWR